MRVVLTNGTFLNGLIHIGEKQFGGDRAGEKAPTGITEQLISLGFESGRMKTGTPPRIDGRSLDYSKMEIQLGDEKLGKFSYTDTPTIPKQMPCHVTYTSEAVHEALKEGFDRSPMFNGRIQGLGPRYCPSIEDGPYRSQKKERREAKAQHSRTLPCAMSLHCPCCHHFHAPSAIKPTLELGRHYDIARCAGCTSGGAAYKPIRSSERGLGTAS